MENLARKTLEHLGQSGWHKGGSGNSIDGYCLGVALGQTCRAANSWEDNCYYKHVSDVVEAVIAEQFPDRYDSSERFSHFNDHDDTTIEDIALVLEKAAIRLDETV